MKKNNVIQPEYFSKYFFATVKQLAARTRNNHALVMLSAMALYIGLGVLYHYYLEEAFRLSRVSSNSMALVIMLAQLLFILLNFYIVSQAFDVSLKINYNRLDTKKKLRILNPLHGWRSGLINTVYYGSCVGLGAFAYQIIEIISEETFDPEKAYQDAQYFYYYDKSLFQEFIDDHSGAAIVSIFLFLILITFITSVFTAANTHISYQNKSGFESMLRSLRHLNAKSWISMTVFRSIYGLILIILSLIAYFVYDYFGTFGQYAGPGLALVGFYFLYPYVTALHTGFYFFNHTKPEKDLETV